MKLYTLDNQFIEETIFHQDNFTGIIIWPDGTKGWFSKGKLHRFDGPTVEHSNGTKSWFIDNKQITKEQHALLIDIMRLKGLI